MKTPRRLLSPSSSKKGEKSKKQQGPKSYTLDSIILHTTSTPKQIDNPLLTIDPKGIYFGPSFSWHIKYSKFDYDLLLDDLDPYESEKESGRHVEASWRIATLDCNKICEC
mmetsp:Transcript_25876/g.37939  ORF Transcript_25876/g.37939 Transcript_25876/m.37939 type:complete len:111 (-) Transcript_25876:1020-1352(-)